MALGNLGDLVTFTPPAGSPGAGVLQTGIVIGGTNAAGTNRMGYVFAVHTGDDLKWAHECVVTSGVTVLSNQTKHNG